MIRIPRLVSEVANTENPNVEDLIYATHSAMTALAGNAQEFELVHTLNRLGSGAHHKVRFINSEFSAEGESYQDAVVALLNGIVQRIHRKNAEQTAA